MRLLLFTFALASAALLSAAEQNAGMRQPYETAKREFLRGKLDAALAALETENGAEPDAHALDLRGSILMEQQKFDDATKLFEAAHAADPNSFGRIHKGDAFLRQKKWSDARAVYQTAMKETNILTSNERLRFAIFISYLGEKDETAAQRALEQVLFPTETAAYYYAQAAWSFAHGKTSEAEKWIARGNEIFPPKATAWFARPLFEFGWIKTKPPLVVE